MCDTALEIDHLTPLVLTSITLPMGYGRKDTRKSLLEVEFRLEPFDDHDKAWWRGARRAASTSYSTSTSSKIRKHSSQRQRTPSSSRELTGISKDILYSTCDENASVSPSTITSSTQNSLAKFQPIPSSLRNRFKQGVWRVEDIRCCGLEKSRLASSQTAPSIRKYYAKLFMYDQSFR